MSPDINQNDLRFMNIALALGRRGVGNVWPNPAVGAVIVLGEHIVGRGWTQPGGRPHAETEALARAGELARGATAYVTLEPCAHTGETGPCAEALVAAGVARVVVATLDPDPRVAGQGCEILRAAGIDVVGGVCEEDARAVNQGFLSRIETGMPYVTLKIASSADGMIARKSGGDQWITSEAARMDGHGLRATNDAILVGRGTVEADDPTLTCRLPGLEQRSPVRVVLDSHHAIAAEAKVLDVSEVPTWIIATESASGRGSEVLEVAADEASHVDIETALLALGDSGITRLLVEGGSAIWTAFLEADLVDEVIWYVAPEVIGDDGIRAIAGMKGPDLAATGAFDLMDERQIGPDMRFDFVRNSS